MHSSSTLLRVLAAITLLSTATACEKEEPAVEAGARLTATIDNGTVSLTKTADITARSRSANQDPGTGDVTATVATEDQSIVSIVKKGDPESQTSTSVSATPDDNGTAVFTVLCKQVGDAVIDFKDDNGEADVTVTCVDEKRTVVINTSDCDDKLQADGISTCKVTVTIPGAPSTAKFSVRLGEVTEADVVIDGDDLEVFSLTADTEPVRFLSDIPLSTGSFFVHSPELGKELGLELVVTDNAANSAKQVVTIGESASEGTPSVTLTSPASVIEGRDATFTLTAKFPNGTLAVDEKLELEATGGTITANGCVNADNIATLDATTASCTFTAKADLLEDNPSAQLKVKATFELDGLPAKEVEVTVVVKALGSLNVTAVAERPVILPRGAAPLLGSQATEEVVVTVTMEKENALTDSIATVAVRQSSRSILRLLKRNNEVLTGDDTGAFTILDAPNGTFTFTVEAPNASALGTGFIDISVTDGAAPVGTPATVESVSLTIERQRRLSTILFIEHTPTDVLGVTGSPRTNQTSARFELRDETGATVAGELINFEVAQGADGVFVSPNGTTNADGIVDAQVTAGRVAAPITIVATVDSRPDLRTTSLPIAVIGGRPNSATSSFQCTAKAIFDPFTTTCVAALNDSFTNVVGSVQQVQFRAEGGNITPNGLSAANGTASATFTFSEPGPGSADVRQWSHATSSPLTASSNTALVAAFPGCFDRTARTPCDLLAICDSSNPSIAGHCPLIASTRNDASICVNDISPEALEALDLGSDPATVSDFADDIFTFEDDLALEQYEAYLRDFRACGLPLSCLRGDSADGIIFDAGDDCPVNAGCLDFSGATECPQNGLLTMLAKVQGEEGFDDVDGDGVRDDGVIPANGAFESFIDFPEPFLDRNSSCSYDDLNHLSSTGPRRGRLPPGEVIRLSDQFIDSGDGIFGTIDPISRDRVETNGKHDTETDIFMTTTVVHLSGGRRLQFGEAVTPGQCGANGNTAVTCGQAATRGGIDDDGDPVALRTSTCTETALSHLGDSAILESCLPVAATFRDGDIASFVYRWTDANGNCPTPDFAGTVSITADGAAEVIADDANYGSQFCGALPGAINASNIDRPWCEEHPLLGAVTRNVSVRAVCGAETGTQLVKLTFTIDDFSVTRTVAVGCPVCGDDRKEGTEECDDGNIADGDGCDAGCLREVEAP